MTHPEPVGNQVYTQEDIQNILNLAIAEHTYQGEFSRSQLFEIGSDLGISPEILQKAEQSWVRTSQDLAKRDEFKRHERAKLQRKAVRFAMVNGSLITLNALMGFGFAWSLYIFVLWGLFLGLKTWSVFTLEGEAYERAFQRWYRSHQVRTVMNRWLDRWLSA
ncbi:MAG: 2TM domain-containing protein [Thermosynechococcaceae cyanobacterium MS004]|nr:2TM domain-containing protein [Thermosynechococcaceae cyanobacterium MS004]